MLSIRGDENVTKWILGMAFFRKYYSIWDLTPDNTRIGLVGGRMERYSQKLDKAPFVLPDFYGLLFATIFVVILLCFILLCLCRLFCRPHDKKRFFSPLPVVNMPKVIPVSPTKPVQASPVREIYVIDEPEIYYEEAE